MESSSDRMLQASLAQKWNISGPEFSYTSTTFDLNYTISDFILDDMISHEIYDENCAEGGTIIPGNVLSSVLTPDGTSPGTGELSRSAQIGVGINATTISSSPIYSEQVVNSQTIGTVRFCHRFMLYTLSATPIEVNFLETLVTLTIDLTDGFAIGNIDVQPKDEFIRTANQAYQVEGFQCNYLNEPLTELQLAQSRNQGSIIRVCVRPDQEARSDGIYMRSIDSFVFERDFGGVVGVISQAAIESGAPAANLLTQLYCTSGDDVCVFETVLMAIFYRLAGAVDGTGVASMQFGSNPIRRRHLRDTGSQRHLEESIVAGVAEFELSMELVPRPSRYSAATTPFRSFFVLSCGIMLFVLLQESI